MNYYNDNDPKCAAWLRALIAAKLIPEGEVDERSIKEIRPADLGGFAQCHFFAGIGGWSYALELTGWPTTRPIWTGSCPCQPFSIGGKRKGNNDERHLWPDFFRLISECKPTTVFGEQVASNDGRQWLAGVRADLEAVGYAVGAADLCAAGVAAPHIRQRLYWVADANRQRRDREHTLLRKEERRCTEGDLLEVAGSGTTGGLANSQDTDGGRTSIEADGGGWTAEAGGPSDWDDFIVIPCHDPKRGTVYRRAPVEPEFFPLAHGLPGRVAQLRGLGNAIVPQVAATFIGAFDAAPAPPATGTEEGGEG